MCAAKRKITRDLTAERLTKRVLVAHHCQTRLTSTPSSTHVWNWIKNDLAGVNYRTVDEFKAACIKSWKAIPQCIIDRSIDSVYRRCRAVVRAKGGVHRLLGSKVRMRPTLGDISREPPENLNNSGIPSLEGPPIIRTLEWFKYKFFLLGGGLKVHK